jgi:hypothetical protein
MSTQHTAAIELQQHMLVLFEPIVRAVTYGSRDNEQSASFSYMLDTVSVRSFN